MSFFFIAYFIIKLYYLLDYLKVFLVKNINNKRCCIKKFSILLHILYHKFIMMYFKFGSSLAYMFVCPLSTTQFSTILKIINTDLIPINSKVKKIIQNGTNGIS